MFFGVCSGFPHRFETKMTWLFLIVNLIKENRPTRNIAGELKL